MRNIVRFDKILVLRVNSTGEGAEPIQKTVEQSKRFWMKSSENWPLEQLKTKKKQFHILKSLLVTGGVKPRSTDFEKNVE